MNSDEEGAKAAFLPKLFANATSHPDNGAKRRSESCTKKLHSDIVFVLLCTISLLAAYGLTRILDPGANGAVETVSQEPAAPPLTPELAKQALLELNWFPVEAIPQVEQMTIREENHGWYRWSCSQFHLEQKTYILLLEPQRGSGACTFVFEGKFEFVDGHWQATPPEETGSYHDELDE